MSEMPVTAYELEEWGGRTALADWVLALDDLSPQAVALYTRICHFAQQAACGGRRMTLNRTWADWASGGDGEAALRELVTARALTKVAAYKGGRTRLQTEPYPPFIQDVQAGRRDRSDVPELNSV